MDGLNGKLCLNFFFLLFKIHKKTITQEFMQVKDGREAPWKPSLKK